MTTANRNYKDSLFTDYFSDKERLIDAYNALAGTDYPLTADVEYATLENVLYRSQNNDIAFVIEGKIVVLIEHQSTINENMPLRLLLYISEIYKRLVSQRMLYHKKIQPIPTPEFIVVYNGQADYPDKSLLKLSDAYLLPSKTEGLELIVPVYNIAKGHNAELLKQSTSLSDYAMFVSLVYDYVGEGDELEKAIGKTLYYCHEHGIMNTYLERQGAEVRNMLLTEWNDDEYREVIREEAIEDGRAEGLAEGLSQGIEQGLSQGIEQGLSQGIEQGLSQGIEQGLSQGIERGRKEGLVEGRAEIARGMKAKGFSIADVADITGLSKEAIAAL